MPQLEVINSTTYRLNLIRDNIELGDIDSPSLLGHIKYNRLHGSWFKFGKSGSPTGLAMIDVPNGVIRVPYGGETVELTCHEYDSDFPDGRAEFNVILESQPTPDGNGDYWQVLDFDSSGLTFSKILPLDEEYDQQTCYDEWYADLYDDHSPLYGHDNGTGIFIRSATEIRTPDNLVVIKSRPEHKVNSYIGKANQANQYKTTHGKNTNPESQYYGKDIGYTRVSQDHVHIPRRELVDNKGKRSRIEDIVIDGLSIKFKLPKSFIEAGSTKYPVQHATGVDPGYTEEMASSGQTGVDGTWTQIQLYGTFGVTTTAAVVCECMLENQQKGTENEIGVRKTGSSLQRTVNLHEAEPSGGGSGDTHCRMFVQGTWDDVTNSFYYYPEDASDLELYLLGYWENVDFTEALSDVSPIDTNNWKKVAVGESTYRYNNVNSSAILYNGSNTREGMRYNSFPVTTIYGATFRLHKSGSPTGSAYVRVRKVSDDSIIGTLGSIDVSTLTGTSTWTLFASPIDNTTSQDIRICVEYTGGDSENNITVGYGTTSDTTLRAYYSGSWTDSSSQRMAGLLIWEGSTPSRVAEIAIVNPYENTYTNGVRETGSSLTRYIAMHEAESGGNSYLDMMVKLDSNATFEGIIGYSLCQLLCLGYFGPELDFVELFQSLNPASSTWADVDLSSYIDEDGRICDFMLLNKGETIDRPLGVRTNGSSVSRFLYEHEAEGGGSEYTGFSMSAETDVDGVVELYGIYNTSPYFTYCYLMGYFKPASLTLLSKSVYDTVSVSDSTTPLLTKLFRALADYVSVSENVSPSLAQLVKAVYDYVSVSEYVEGSPVLTLLSKLVYDTVSVNDTSATNLPLVKLVTDWISVLESTDTTKIPLQKLITDIVEVLESINTFLPGEPTGKLLSDLVSVSEYVEGELLTTGADQMVSADVEQYASQYMSRDGILWQTPLKGILFFIDDTTQRVRYCRTGNGGSTWNAPQNLWTETCVALDVWADWQTPGDSGVRVHVAAIERTSNRLLYAYYDMDTYSMGGSTVIYQVPDIVHATISRQYNQVSITKTRSGKFAIAAHITDDDYDDYFLYYTSPTGVTWTSRNTPWEDDNTNILQLFPGNETDPDDIWCLFWDNYDDEISLKTWDNSGLSWSEQVIATSMVLYYLGFQMSGHIRQCDGHLLVSAYNKMSGTGINLLTWEVNGASSIVQKSNILTDQDDAWQISLFIDQTNNDAYAVYTRGTKYGWMLAYYKKSTDNMATWGSEQTLMENDATDLGFVGAGALKSNWGGKFMPVWHVEDSPESVWYNYDNSISITGKMTKCMADVVSVSDSTVPDLLLFIALYDAIAVSENLQPLLPVLKQSLADYVEVTDDTTPFLMGGFLYKLLYDTVQIADQVSAYPTTLNAGLIDIVAISDQIDVNLDLVLALYDYVSVTDSTSPLLPYLTRAVQDMVNVSDAVHRNKPGSAVVHDTVGVSDQLSTYMALASLLFDVVAVADSVESYPTVLYQHITDLVEVTEYVLSYAPGLMLAKLVVDTVAVTDQVDIYPTMLQTALADIVAVSDNLQTNLALIKSMYDTVSVTDSTSTLLNLLIQLYDFVSVVDSTTGSLGTLQALIIDSVGVSDQQAVNLALAKLIQDYVSVSDNQELAASLLQTLLHDEVVVSDSALIGMFGVLLDLIISTKPYHNLEVATIPYHNLDVEAKPYYNMEVTTGGL